MVVDGSLRGVRGDGEDVWRVMRGEEGGGEVVERVERERREEKSLGGDWEKR